MMKKGRSRQHRYCFYCQNDDDVKKLPALDVYPQNIIRQRTNDDDDAQPLVEFRHFLYHKVVKADGEHDYRT